MSDVNQCELPVANDRLAAFQDPETIRKLLGDTRSIAVVGLSPKELRASYFVAFYLKRNGYRILPVNPRADEILGERCWPSVAALPEPVDVVCIFRAPDAVPGIVEEAAPKARGVWMQYGVIHEHAAARARELGLEVVMDRCMKVEHARYFGRLHWLGFSTRRITARRGQVA